MEYENWNAVVKMKVGAKNETVPFWATFELGFTALVSPNCTDCLTYPYPYDAQYSLDQGSLTFLSNTTEVYRVAVRDENGEKVFLHGRWAMENIGLEHVIDKTFNNTG
jgi:hypothetical protein